MIRIGKAYQEVLAYAKEHEIDLISVGGSVVSLGALFGSNVDRILRQAPCPVLIARPIKLADPDALTQSEDQAGNQM